MTFFGLRLVKFYLLSINMFFCIRMFLEAFYKRGRNKEYKISSRKINQL